MQIITNNQPRNLISWYDLTEKEKADFDYIEDGAFSGFRYKGQMYDLGEFMHCEQSVNGLANWHGISSDSFFSGVLVKLVDDDSVVVGRYFS